ncbi:hypothetical protein WJX72_012528 [[Myrmecia] bisecta]|uniref:Nodulin-like domain-containing protein n=1 Tax=[Myrmecia] bisecta TaxID=41462 RepID=A0AAW1QA98_9CHLO
MQEATSAARMAFQLPCFNRQKRDPGAEPLYWSKWLTFSASCFVMLSAGLAYTFSVYSHALKEEFDYSQTEIDGIGTACNIGGYLAIFAGLFYDSVKHWNRMGPMLTIAIGAILQLAGYTGLWLAATGHFPLPVKYWMLVLLAIVACNGQTWFETAALVTCVRNFETERGTVIGILKAFLGLSASVYITIYVAFLEPNEVSFLKLLALAPTAVALVCMIFINYVPYIQVEPHTKAHAFHMTFVTVIALAAYQAVIAVVRRSATLDYWAGVLMTSAVAVLLLPVLSVPFIFGGLRSRRLWNEQLEARIKSRTASPSRDARLQNAPDYGARPLSRSISAGWGPAPAFSRAKTSPAALETRLLLLPQANDMFVAPRKQDWTPLQCLASLDFYLLWLVNGIGSGAGLTLLNNIAEQVIALTGDGPRTSSSVFVSVFSIANCIGRIISGFVPDHLMRTYWLPRTVALILLTAIMTLASFLNAFASLKLLSLGALLTGMAFGGFQGLTPAVTSELFGLQNFATNYALVQLGSALGSTFLATWLAGTMYDRALERHPSPTGTCIGTDCFRTTFLIVAGLSGLAMLLSLLLWSRTRNVYKTIIEAQNEERKHRGIQAEYEESKEILEEFVSENERLSQLLVRGRDLVAEVQQAIINSPCLSSDPAGPRVFAAVDELDQLVSQGCQLLPEQEELRQKLAALPTLWRRRAVA